MMSPSTPELSGWEIVRLPPVGANHPTKNTYEDKSGSEPVPEKLDLSDLQIVPYVLDVQPIGEGVPLEPHRKRSSKRNPDGTRADLETIEFHRRPEWLPVDWLMWKVVRVSGKSVGHVDVYYYSPDLIRCRSKGDLFYKLVTGVKRPPNLKMTYTPVDIEYDVPELEIWHGPAAGVTVANTRRTKFYPKDYEVAEQSIHMKPPTGIKRVRIPAGTPYSAIGKSTFNKYYQGPSGR